MEKESATVSIGGRDVPISEILDIFVEGHRWMALVYGEAAVDVDPRVVDKIIELRPELVDQAIIDTRDGAREMHEWLSRG